MEVIKTKTVLVEDLDLSVQGNVDKLHDILKQHATGFWHLLSTDQENVMECVLRPLSDDITKAGYKWKDYKEFEENFYKGRLLGVAPVGFRYLG